MNDIWRHLEVRALSKGKNLTNTEKRLLEYLDSSENCIGLFIPQVVIPPFIVDFYCDQLSLVIEIDGESHKDILDSDSTRDEELNQKGIKVLRFSNNQIFHEFEYVKQQIEFEIKFRKKNKTNIHQVDLKSTTKKSSNSRKMVIPLPWVVNEGNPNISSHKTRASKVKVIRTRSKSGSASKHSCEVCKHPILDSDLRTRYRLDDGTPIGWAHKVCRR
jgi:very-short-patch-repair endonuclease